MEHWYLQPKKVEFFGLRIHAAAEIIWYHQYSIPTRVSLLLTGD